MNYNSPTQFISQPITRIGCLIDIDFFTALKNVRAATGVVHKVDVGVEMRCIWVEAIR